jgi:hypothetical protein
MAEHGVADGDFCQAIVANLRLQHTKVDLLFQHLNHSMEIFQQILKITNFNIKIADSYKDSQAEIYSFTFRYLEWVFFRNASLKRTTYRQLLEVVEEAEITPTCQTRFLLFMREWTKDNELLVSDRAGVALCLQKLLDILNDQPDPVSTVGVLVLTILPNLLSHKGVFFKDNQNELVRLLFSKKYRQLIDFLAGRASVQMLEQIAANSQAFSAVHTVEKTKVMILHVEVRFLVQYLVMLTACMEQKNAFTAQFCQKLFEPALIQEILNFPQATFDMKCVLLNFLLCGLRADPHNSMNSIHLATKMLPTLVQEFMLSVKTLLDQSEEYAEMADVMVVSESFCEVFEILVENYVLSLAEVFEEMAELDIQEQGYPNFSEVLQTNLDLVLDILDKSISKFSVELRRKFTVLVSKLIRSPGKARMQDLVAKAEAVDKKHNLLADELMSILTRKAKAEDDTSNSKLNLHSVISELISLSKTEGFDDCHSENFLNICQHLEKELEGKPALHVIGSSLLQTLADKEQIASVDWRAYSFTINLLQYYLDQAGTDLNELTSRQTDLTELGCIENIAEVLCLTEKDQVRLEAVKFIITLFDNGNKQAQVRFERLAVDEEKKAARPVLWEVGQQISKKVEDLDSICKRLRQERMEKQFYEASILKHSGQMADLATKHKLSRSCEAYFRMLQNFCEGHNDGLQALMTAQNYEGQSHNFLETGISIYGLFLQHLDEATSKMIIQTLDFLVESIQGPNKSNQDFVFRSKFFEYFNDYIVEFEEALEDQNKEKVEMLSDIVQKSVTVVFSLLEGNTGRKDIYSEIGKFINIKSLLRVLTHNFESYFSKQVTEIGNPENLLMTIKTKTFDEELIEMFEIFFLIKYMDKNLSSDNGTNLSSSLTGVEESCYHFFELCSGSIEISFHDSLELIYFIKHPATSYLSQEQQTEFLDNVRRDSITNKLMDLQLMSKRLMMLMDYNNYSSKSGGTVIKSARKVYSYISKVLVTVIFLVMILVFLTDEYNAETFLSVKIESEVLYVGRYLLLVLCVIRLVATCIYLGPLHLKEEWANQFSKYASYLHSQVSCIHQMKKDIEGPKKDELKDNYLKMRESTDLISYKESIELVEYARKFENFAVVSPRFYYIMKTIEFYLGVPRLVYFVYTLLCPILSIYYRNDFFICFLMFDLIVSFDYIVRI